MTPEFKKAPVTPRREVLRDQLPLTAVENLPSRAETALSHPISGSFLEESYSIKPKNLANPNFHPGAGAKLDQKQSILSRQVRKGDGEKENSMPFDFINVAARRQTPTFKDSQHPASINLMGCQQEPRKVSHTFGRHFGAAQPGHAPPWPLTQESVLEEGRQQISMPVPERSQERAVHRQYEGGMASLLSKIESQQRAVKEIYAGKEGIRPPTPIRGLLDASKSAARRLEGRGQRGFANFLKENSQTSSFLLEDD